ncbi:hypothetical protein Rs2_04660 [Raphanus sativus]|nr:hypothetical protein Rs2_04660 [Raphanus sativus]
MDQRTRTRVNLREPETDKHHTRKLQPTHFIETPQTNSDERESSDLKIDLMETPSSHKDQPQPPTQRVPRQQLTTTTEIDDQNPKPNPTTVNLSLVMRAKKGLLRDPKIVSLPTENASSLHRSRKPPLDGPNQDPEHHHRVPTDHQENRSGQI